MPKARKNDYQDWTFPNKGGGPSDLGPRMVHEDPSLTNPDDDHQGLKQGVRRVLDEEIEVDVKGLVRKYEEHDLGGEFADGPERRLPVIKRNINTDLPADNQYTEEEVELGPSFQHEEQHENPEFQIEDDFQPEDYPDDPETFYHNDPPLHNRVSYHANRQESDALSTKQVKEFDAAAAREASKLQWSSQHSSTPPCPPPNQRKQLDALPVVPAQEMTNARYDELDVHARKGGSDYRSRKVPGYDESDDIAAQKKKAAAQAGDRMSWKSRARSRGDEMLDYVVSKAGSKANRTVVILIALGLFAILIAIVFMVIYFSTGQKSLPTVTMQPTDAGPTDTGGSIVIVGVNLDATVRLSNRAFIPQYNNDLSPQYRSLADNFTNTMDDVFYGSDLGDVYNGTQVNGFSPGSIIVDFVIMLLSPPMTAPGDMTTPAGSIDDRLKKIEEDVQAAVQEVIEEAADEGNLDELGVDSTSFVVNDVGVDVRVITEAPTTASSTGTTLRQTTPTTTLTPATTPIPVTTQTPDTTPPTIVCPEDKIVYLGTGEFSANVTWPPIEADDDSGHVTVTTDMTEGLWDAGEYTVVATATDPSGNSDQCSFNVTVKDRTCPAGWLRRTDGCYRLAWADPVDYPQAVQLCSELDSFPFVPNSRSEMDFALEFLGDIGIGYIWVGCDDKDTQRRFECLDGSRIGSQSNLWHPGQPNSYNSENCVALVFGQRLHDWSCTWNQPRTLCERVAD
ncbi:uncharacterized protein LOC121420084 [Lytechinus variegatus]|uniref:uncharacterized protein LOC121420084 n=1 Tax=Lytechinus variegatus TaxID=7654 RepID=UPI001BB10A03|nr:uncharacterized protein LOC121420084 [Lytechinus variegatus]